MMITVDDLMMLPYEYEVIQDPDEGSSVVSFPDLTSGRTEAAAVANIPDAKRAWFKAAIEDGVAISEPSHLLVY